MPAVEVTELAAYKDERGNEIRFSGRIEQNMMIRFRGSNNTLIVGDTPRFTALTINFDCDNGTVTIGSNTGKRVPAFSAGIRVGQDAAVRIGDNVSSTGSVTISAAEGTTVQIGNDVMFASRNEVRADDAHVIFDVRTGKRINPSQSIKIGDHVWIAAGATVLGGVEIGSGSVIGLGSIVTRKIPNNVIAVGVPAKVVRKDIAWERPHTTLTRPYYKPDASTVDRSRRYWRLTEDDESAAPAKQAAKKAAKKTAQNKPPAPLWRRAAGRLVREYRQRSAARR
jgi:acetyltransferase-like isoleucine patch superfamily enzyme